MSGQRDDLFAQAQSGQRWAQEELVKNIYHWSTAWRRGFG